MVKNILAMRGIIASHEPADRPFDRIRRRSSGRGDIWRRDEVVIAIRGKKNWLSVLTDRDAEPVHRL